MKKCLTLLVLTISSLMYAGPMRFSYTDVEGTTHEISSMNVDPEIRDLTPEQMSRMAPYLSMRPVMQDNGDYALHCHIRGLGGGPVGAATGFWVGKGAVYACTHGIIHGVGWLIPGGGFVATVVSSTIAAPVEAVSNAVGIGCAIALGTATGPV